MWTGDGRQILYVSVRAGGYAGIYRRSSDGSGAEELLYRYTPGAPIFLQDLSPDGGYLTFNSGGVVLVVPLTGTDPSSRPPGDRAVPGGV
jgi:Tol biopolymer transport system component